MATRKPLVLVGGVRQELPAADTLPLTALAPVVAASITSGDTTHAPSGDAVFDALAKKVPGTVLFRAYQSASQTIPSATFTTVIYGTENFDTGGNYNTATGEFTAPLAGVYSISAFSHVKNLADNGAIVTSVFVNGAEHSRLGEESVANASASAALAVMNGSTAMVRLSANDVVTIRVFAQSISGDPVVTPAPSAGTRLTYFFGFLLMAE